MKSARLTKAPRGRGRGTAAPPAGDPPGIPVPTEFGLSLEFYRPHDQYINYPDKSARKKLDKSLASQTEVEWSSYKTNRDGLQKKYKSLQEISEQYPAGQDEENSDDFDGDDPIVFARQSVRDIQPILINCGFTAAEQAQFLKSMSITHSTSWEDVDDLRTMDSELWIHSLVSREVVYCKYYYHCRARSYEIEYENQMGITCYDGSKLTPSGREDVSEDQRHGMGLNLFAVFQEENLPYTKDDDDWYRLPKKDWNMTRGHISLIRAALFGCSKPPNSTDQPLPVHPLSAKLDDYSLMRILFVSLSQGHYEEESWVDYHLKTTCGVKLEGSDLWYFDDSNEETIRNAREDLKRRLIDRRGESEEEDESYEGERDEQQDDEAWAEEQVEMYAKGPRGGMGGLLEGLEGLRGGMPGGGPPGCAQQ